jgi:hypothetical protein
MMNIPNRQHLEFAERFREELQSRLDLPCLLLTQSEGGWIELGKPASDQAGMASLAACFHRRSPAWAPRGSGPWLLDDPEDPDRSLVVLRGTAEQDYRLLLAFATPPLPLRWLHAVLDSTRELVARRLEDEGREGETLDYIRQVTQDFEELTWLRHSHEHASDYDLTTPVAQFAKGCIESMAAVIRAEQLILLEYLDSESDPDQRGLAVHHLGGEQELLGQPDLFRPLLTLLEAQTGRWPMILETPWSKPWPAEFDAIGHCMVTPVSKGDQRYGWLLAINKICPECHAIVSPATSSPLCEHRFGTFEAGLLTTAANMLASQASNTRLFHEQEELMTGMVRAIINAIDAKDTYTCGHSERVASFAMAVAAHLGLSAQDCEDIYLAGLLHDVGKIGIPDAILKKPGPLTDEEYAVIKTHPTIGHAILKHLRKIDYALPGILHHHEEVDGTGYPSGLQADAIPLIARILAVCDAYDAMTSNRPYRDGMPSAKAEEILLRESGKMWDGEIVEAFLTCLREGHIEPGQRVESPRATPRTPLKESLPSSLLQGLAVLPSVTPSHPL